MSKLTDILTAGVIGIGALAVAGCAPAPAHVAQDGLPAAVEEMSDDYTFIDSGVQGRVSVFQSSAKPMASGNFNMDVWPDIVVVDRDGKIHIYENLGNGEFEDKGYIGVVTRYQSSIPSITVEDFDLNGLDDIGIVDRDGHIHVFYNETK